ncbi:MAG: WG repeat-containing protein [Rikenellaceae bacterium]|jgi:hypothetical protein|nr:WG repeat-containing protein [Rikenellaceae bacterium]
MKNIRKPLCATALLAVFCATGAGLRAQIVLKPHFTEFSRKIVVPKWAVIHPEIHEGMISINASGILYVNAANGEYVWGSASPVNMPSNTAPVYFSGGASMSMESSPYGKKFKIVYPDGKFRELVGDYLRASQFCEGYALVCKGNLMSAKQIFIDKNGKEVFPALTSTVRGMSDDMVVRPLREGRRLYYNAELNKYGYADEKGAIVIKSQFQDAHDFSEGLAAVMISKEGKGLWGFIDKTGKLVIPHTWPSPPGRFSEGLAVVRDGIEDGETHPTTLIDKTGRQVMEPQMWGINEFHEGFSWVATGCDKLFIMDRDFKEVKDMTEYFYYNGNGFGVCNFSLGGYGRKWGIDFPQGRQSLHQGGIEAGDIFAPDGQLLFNCLDGDGNDVALHSPTEGDLMFCKVRMKNQAQLPQESMTVDCFINLSGEIVYYFVEGTEGFEGKQPVQVK